MTEFTLDKLTRAILIATAVWLGACYAWELKTTALESLVDMENASIQENKRLLREQNCENVEPLSHDDEFVPPLASGNSERPDVW